MKAVVLVGGLGRRLRPFTFSVPKPLLPVGDTPVLELIIRSLSQSGIDELILATGYQAELIRAFCGDGSRFGVAISYIHEHEPLGTAGPLALLKDRISPDEQVLLVNGDIITHLDFRELVQFADARSFDLTIGYTTYVYQSPFGVLSVENDQVVDIVEKPAVDYAISAGIYAVRAAALDVIPDAGGFFTVPELAHELLARGRSVGAFHIRDFWLGMEHMESFDQAVRELGGAIPGGLLE
jgi:NDP-sugar pyrophosphorylase family protein